MIFGGSKYNNSKKSSRRQSLMENKVEGNSRKSSFRFDRKSTDNEDIRQAYLTSAKNDTDGYNIIMSKPQNQLAPIINDQKGKKVVGLNISHDDTISRKYLKGKIHKNIKDVLENDKTFIDPESGLINRNKKLVAVDYIEYKRETMNVFFQKNSRRTEEAKSIKRDKILQKIEFHQEQFDKKERKKAEMEEFINIMICKLLRLNSQRLWIIIIY